jgi:hypothetical protein
LVTQAPFRKSDFPGIYADPEAVALLVAALKAISPLKAGRCDKVGRNRRRADDGGHDARKAG